MFTYEEFDKHVSRIAAGLRQLGFRPGDTVGFHTEVSIDLILGFYGVIFAGGSAVFAKANLGKSKWVTSGDFFGDARGGRVCASSSMLLCWQLRFVDA